MHKTHIFVGNPKLTFNFNVMIYSDDGKNKLIYHRFDVVITATTGTELDAWIGAVLRNNLLYAAEKIGISGGGSTLFRMCQRFPLSSRYPLYNELKDGFPPPYYLYVREKKSIGLTRLYEGQSVSFSLILIGDIVKYTKQFIEAIDFMCRKGLGMYSKPFALSEVREVSSIGENQLLCHHGKIITDKLLFPIDIETVQSHSRSTETRGRVQIIFESPVCLVKSRKRTDPPGYQEKSNLFPGFYQIVRTAAYRFEKLQCLYTTQDEISHTDYLRQQTEDFVEGAARLEIEEINLKRIELKSSRRKNRDENRIPLTGFIGEMTFRGNYQPYITLLKFMEHLGVGHALTYGFGKYKITEL